MILKHKKARFIKKHGKHSLTDLLKTSELWPFTIADYARQYSMTRQCAHELFRSYYPYINYKKKRHELMSQVKNDRLTCGRNPKSVLVDCKSSPMTTGMIGEIEVTEILRNSGFDVQISKNTSSDIIVNGLRCDIKTACTPWAAKNSRTYYYRFKSSKIQRETNDFFILYIRPLKGIILKPAYLVKANMIYIRASNIPPSNLYFLKT